MSMTLGEQLRAKFAAREWAKDDAAHQQMENVQASKKFFQVTNNLSRATFDQIKYHPDTRKNVTRELVAKGYKYNSASAIVGHMLRQGVAQVDDEGVVHVTTDEYVPLKSAASLRNQEKKVQPRKKVVVVAKGKSRPVSAPPAPAGLASLKPLPTSTAPEVPRVDALLRSLSVLEARDLYDALKNIFGGK